jgi:hypothetical protein
LQKVVQIVAKNQYTTCTGGKRSLNTSDTSVIFQKLPKVLEQPNRREFAQSGHHVYELNLVGGEI